MPSRLRVIHRPGSVVDATANRASRAFLKSVIDDESRSPADRLLHHRWLVELDGQTAGRNDWRFSMICCSAGSGVARHLRRCSYRPAVALELFWICLREGEFNDGVVGLSRPQLAAELGVEPRVVSRLMGELMRIGVLIREHVGDDGIRLSVPRYRVSPRVSTNARRAERSAAQAAAPALTVV